MAGALAGLVTCFNLVNTDTVLSSLAFVFVPGGHAVSWVPLCVWVPGFRLGCLAGFRLLAGWPVFLFCGVPFLWGFVVVVVLGALVVFFASLSRSVFRWLLCLVVWVGALSFCCAVLFVLGLWFSIPGVFFWGLASLRTAFFVLLSCRPFRGRHLFSSSLLSFVSSFHAFCVLSGIPGAGLSQDTLSSRRPLTGFSLLPCTSFGLLVLRLVPS